MLHAVEAAARCDVRVLLEGQSGTGKELIARAIHQLSDRKNGPFIAIDCGAIPENLVESELFGHVRGAFTGANTARIGLIEEANKGTLFMDEIANLPLPAQAKLLRVLQESVVRPVGSNATRPIDVRIISAGSAPLQSLVKTKEFREDLFYRLHVYPIQVPSLNDRPDDIPLLANLFLSRFSLEHGKQIQTFQQDILEFIRHRPWPGNIRQLENFVERLVALCPPNRETIGRDLLPETLRRELKEIDKLWHDAHVTKSLRDSVAEFETREIRQALLQSDWNQAKAARHLKISPETLRYKIKNLGIHK
jgi:DNA-binding NtrC family response regulator